MAEDVIDNAIDYLEQVGWQQGRYFPMRPSQRALSLADVFSSRELPMCVMGALYGSAQQTGVSDSGRTLSSIISTFCSVVGPDPVAWNDKPGRTKEEVIAALRELKEKMS